MHNKDLEFLYLLLYNHVDEVYKVSSDTEDQYWSEKLLTCEGSLFQDWYKLDKIKRLYCRSGMGPVEYVGVNPQNHNSLVLKYHIKITCKHF